MLLEIVNFTAEFIATICMGPSLMSSVFIYLWDFYPAFPPSRDPKVGYNIKII